MTSITDSAIRSFSRLLNLLDGYLSGIAL
jgi:hypothetical protein